MACRWHSRYTNSITRPGMRIGRTWRADLSYHLQFGASPTIDFFRNICLAGAAFYGTVILVSTAIHLWR